MLALTGRRWALGVLLGWACTCSGIDDVAARAGTDSIGSASVTSSATPLSVIDELVERHLQSASNAITYPTVTGLQEMLLKLQQENPDLVKVWNAQETYGLPSPNTQCRSGLCKHWFISITNRTSAAEPERPAFSRSMRDRPQVFFSGNLHGDETVGPATLVTLINLIIGAARPGSPNYNAWINKLVNTRNIVMMPISNPAGYDNHQREEDGKDPNRDFPYMTSVCMRTVTAKAVNEVWREHLFQLAITFHGGMQAISYEWGAPNHEAHGSASPDDTAQAHLGAMMREIAGKYKAAGVDGDGWYPVGKMNTVVYPVDGGMEDWAYAG